LAIRIILQTVIWLGAMGAVLFLAAGDWRWAQGWVFLAVNAIGSLMVSFWLARRDPALLEARMTSPLRGDQRPADRRLVMLIAAGFVAWIVVMGLTGHRFASGSNALWGQALGGITLAACFVMVALVFHYNSFAVPQVRVQAEREQTVISDGPYRFVRHPMYAGALMYFLGAPLLLGSLWGLAGGVLLTIAMGVRAVGEERLLIQDLPGYEGYLSQVRYRLVPGLW